MASSDSPNRLTVGSEVFQALTYGKGISVMSPLGGAGFRSCCESSRNDTTRLIGRLFCFILLWLMFAITVQMFKGSTSLQCPRQHGVKTRGAVRENGLGDLDHVLFMAIEGVFSGCVFAHLVGHDRFDLDVSFY